MMKQIRNRHIVMLITLFTLCVSCKKDWLDVKTDISLTTPTTLKDLQALLDNTSEIFNVLSPALGEISADNYYLALQNFLPRQNWEQNAHIWAKDIFVEPVSIQDWIYPYQKVYYCNVVLEAAAKIIPTPDNQAELNSIRGQAFFHRAFSFYEISSIFAKPYVSSSASTDLGIPLRLSSDFNEKTTRSTVQQTYDRIINDLDSAVALLGSQLPNSNLYKLRPTKTAAYGMLARVYLSMEDYQRSFNNADASLSLYKSLLNYTPYTGSTVAIPKFNTEVVFHNTMYSSSVISSNATVDSNLYNTYATNDLRRTAFFRTTGSGTSARIVYKGSYEGTITVPLFCGLATDELYLTRAECNVRLGRRQSALNDLDSLLKQRRSGTFASTTATTDDQALTIILNERRKELCFRGIRWTDLRRLNRDDRFKITVRRDVDGKTYYLMPNDLAKYVLPIPLDVIRLTGIPQNERQ